MQVLQKSRSCLTIGEPVITTVQDGSMKILLRVQPHPTDIHISLVAMVLQNSWELDPLFLKQGNLRVAL